MPRTPHQSGLFATPQRVLRIGEIERACRKRGIWPVVGTDEVGRGPLAGPVVAAAVVLQDSARLPGLDDSKRLTELQREKLVPLIEAQAVAAAVVEGSVELIDELNILWASMRAMRDAVRQCLAQVAQAGGTRPMVVLVDGNRQIPDLVSPGQQAIVKGDQRSRSIAAASVLAKVYRDRLMVQMAHDWPGYGFERHKGYPTAEHLRALAELGPTPHHRRSFGPVRAELDARSLS